MGDHDAHPRVVDVVRRDQGEERPDLGQCLAADVLPGARPQRVVEGLLVGVDVEVDGLGLGHLEERLGLGHAALADRQRAPAEASSPTYQWTRTSGPETVFQSNRVSS